MEQNEKIINFEEKMRSKQIKKLLHMTKNNAGNNTLAEMYMQFIAFANETYEEFEIQEADELLRSFLKGASLYLDKKYIQSLKINEDENG